MHHYECAHGHSLYTTDPAPCAVYCPECRQRMHRVTLTERVIASTERPRTWAARLMRQVR